MQGNLLFSTVFLLENGTTAHLAVQTKHQGDVSDLSLSLTLTSSSLNPIIPIVLKNILDTRY